jgi:glycosyltransferase involved in cell wall biosynthesis
VPNPKRIIVIVSNDLATDQRVQKVCNSLLEFGYLPFLVGRELPESPSMPDLSYKFYRKKLIFTSGPFFYIELNLWLFFYLLFSKMDGIHSNDLDTLLPAFLVSKLRKKKLVYDTHEYFTGVPELLSRPRVRKFWRFIEGSIFPKLKHIFTVNDSIADLYEQDYGNRPSVMRNIPLRKQAIYQPKTRAELGLPPEKFILILQGSGINVDRGAEEALLMMKHLTNCILIILGSGDVLDVLKKMAHDEGISDKVMFFPRMPYDEMMHYTRVADLGLTLDKDTNINYRFSLPNKLFDYIHAEIPVLCSDLPEVKHIVKTYDIGIVALNHHPENLAKEVDALREDPHRIEQLRTNCTMARLKLSWENEVQALRRVYSEI